MLFEKIVVIDDDPRIIKSLTLALDWYDIVSFQDGHEAIAYLKKPNNVSLVILDVFMGGMDGLSVLHEIKKIDENIVVIMMTGYGTKDIAIEALRQHADDFVEKPFNTEELKDKIKMILRAKSYLLNPECKKDQKIEYMKRFIDKNYAIASLKDISAELCLSPKYVSRLFRKKTKCAFRRYKLNQRIKMAKIFLRGSSFDVNQIAFKLGYENAESFMRIFKKVTGYTPTQFRRSRRD